MFTGIIEEIGIVERMVQQGEAIVLTIQANKILTDVHLGDSIAVNGVCLTVTSFTNHRFSVDIMPETVRSTSLQQLRKGSKVNLERAMSANGRFGGHFVSGHVDGVGTIVNKTRVSNAIYYEIELPEELSRFVLLKGSICVDGTSLTVFGKADRSFTISLIPHTLSETIIGAKDAGDIVNLECDMLAKYIEQFVMMRESNTKKSSISEGFLKEQGYM
ncbi:riboflavin synthase [Bacillus suaedaesalsae]|uniref:Riboflavin synthase n=1 Tax=Bacillus suaedaesalsae TaxID=2810349 RepID=A0ABS2DN75_9BACI|nr:riboflavin synthase [Bacillus suaedaesalsae]